MNENTSNSRVACWWTLHFPFSLNWMGHSSRMKVRVSRIQCLLFLPERTVSSGKVTLSIHRNSRYKRKTKDLERDSDKEQVRRNIDETIYYRDKQEFRLAIESFNFILTKNQSFSQIYIKYKLDYCSDRAKFTMLTSRSKK